MYYELTKSEKKIARIVMDKGLDNHYRRNLLDIEKIIEKWKDGLFKNPGDAYMTLYKTVSRNDKNIGKIYNYKGGSRWVEIISMQLADGVITEDDLKDFSDGIREVIHFLAGK